ncbi:MAG TPA: hypothetical protein VM597_24670 [Gemmataceae bacterium]|nr:hypothetical protein [Gemmataceae bacterium]
MYRSLVGLIATAPLLAAPGVKEKDADVLYFPVQEAAKRVWEMSVHVTAVRPAPSESVETVTKVEGRDGKFRVIVERQYTGKTVKGRT